ncbi:MAG: hypothetical protein JKX95_07530, partial [Bacteroidia bacterium]|nr:hypothetical protein [Bacteroidia bacterium]
MIDLKTLIERIITLISLTLIFSLSLKGQTVYNAVDYVDMNEGYTMSKSNIAQFSDVEYVADLYQLNFDTTGENMVWDFSLLEPLTQIADTMYDPAESGLVDALINDCHSACKWNHTCYDTCGIIEWDCYTKCHGVCTDSCIIEMYKYNTNLTKIFLDTIDFEVVQITDIQQMYLKTNSTLLTDKFGYKLSSFGIELLTDIIDYDSADVMYQFPLEYGNSDASTSSYEINAFDIIVWKHWQSRYNEVEGWGKLITPFGTFDSTLKVRTEIYTIDTIWWGGETFTIPDTLNLDSIVEYKWFSSDYGLPVLTAKMLLMNGHTLLLDVSYLDSLRCFDASANAFPLPPFAFLDSTDT